MTDSEDALAARLQWALRAARDAGRLTLEHFQRADLEVEHKADESPVTVADRAAEQLLRETIAAEFPGDAILGEEFPEKPGDSGFRWILDPIDGTKSFISGVPLYANLIGVESGGRSVVGVINIPALEERVYAAVGQGAWYQSGDSEATPARVANGRLSEGLFVTSELEGYVDNGRLDALLQLERLARFTRTWGDAYGYLLVATGRALGMVDPVVSVWDIAAVQPIMEEAGGSLTDWQGQPTIYSGDAVGTNPAALEEILAVTGKFAR
jgi:histidinol phosphatase-like enzyme (inositol monophosphatase family)